MLAASLAGCAVPVRVPPTPQVIEIPVYQPIPVGCRQRIRVWWPDEATLGDILRIQSEALAAYERQVECIEGLMP
jgi:hypothetical protein